MSHKLPLLAGGCPASSPVAGAAALADHTADVDADPGRVGDAPAAAALAADAALGLVDAGELDGLALPALEPEDPVASAITCQPSR